MYLPSFTAIARQFGATLPQVERTLTAYLFGLAFGQLFYGPAADRFGRKRPLYVGLVLFTLASVGCMFAHSVDSLMLLRTLQAIGGCAEMVIARAIVRDLFDDRTAVGVFSSLMLVMGVAPILAPLMGGFIVNHFGWQAVFCVLAIAGLICFMGAVFLLPESLPIERRQQLSIASTMGLYRRLLTHRIFIVHTLTVSLACAALFAYVGGSPGLFIDTYHIPAQKFGFFFGANAFCLIMMSQVNGRLARRIDARKIAALGAGGVDRGGGNFTGGDVHTRRRVVGDLPVLVCVSGNVWIYFPQYHGAGDVAAWRERGECFGTIGVLSIFRQCAGWHHRDQSSIYRTDGHGDSDCRRDGIDTDHPGVGADFVVGVAAVF